MEDGASAGGACLRGLLCAPRRRPSGGDEGLPRGTQSGADSALFLRGQAGAAARRAGRRPPHRPLDAPPAGDGRLLQPAPCSSGKGRLLDSQANRQRCFPRTPHRDESEWGAVAPRSRLPARRSQAAPALGAGAPCGESSSAQHALPGRRLRPFRNSAGWEAGSGPGS